MIRLVPAKTEMLLHITRLIVNRSEIDCRYIFIVEFSAEVSLEIKVENLFAKTEKQLYLLPENCLSQDQNNKINICQADPVESGLR